MLIIMRAKSTHLLLTPLLTRLWLPLDSGQCQGPGSFIQFGFCPPLIIAAVPTTHSSLWYTWTQKIPPNSYFLSQQYKWQSVWGYSQEIAKEKCQSLKKTIKSQFGLSWHCHLDKDRRRERIMTTKLADTQTQVRPPKGARQSDRFVKTWLEALSGRAGVRGQVGMDGI